MGSNPGKYEFKKSSQVFENGFCRDKRNVRNFFGNVTPKTLKSKARVRVRKVIFSTAIESNGTRDIELARDKK